MLRVTMALWAVVAAVLVAIQAPVGVRACSTKYDGYRDSPEGVTQCVS